MKKKTSKNTNDKKIVKKQFFKRKKKIVDYDDNEEELQIEEDLENGLEENENYLKSHFDSIEEIELSENEQPEEEEESEPEEILEEVAVKKIKNKKKPDKTKFYVEPKKFDEEIVKYYESGFMSNDLAEMVSKISNKLSYAPNFINYSYREEMVGDGIIRMMKALISKKYNREKGTNPFSYFTRIAFNAFRNRIKKEKHIHETHEKYRMELMSMSEGYSNLLKNNNIRIMKERDRLLE